MTTTPRTPTILLIPGHWLGAWAWDDVLKHLTAAGHRAIPLTLPGLDDTDADRLTKTLDEQVMAIEQAASSESGPVVVVAHSGANAPVSLMIDRHPDLVSRVIWVDSGPASSGVAFAPDFPDDAEGLALPPFETLAQQASLEGLSAEVLERFRERAVSEPGTVLLQTVHLTNEARFDVPTTFVCCSMSSSQVKGLVEAGHPMFAEVAPLTRVDYLDLPTGHWPMWSRAADLAEVLASEASRTEAWWPVTSA